jgi:protein-S-isoprenylcysteine O-methyltransferase Ste14
VTIDSFERQVQRSTSVAWLAMTAMALYGARRGRHAAGRRVGSPFTERPGWLYAIVGSVYLFLIVRLWRPLPMGHAPVARAATTSVGAVFSGVGTGLIIAGRLALGDMYNVSSVFGTQLYTGHRLVTSGPFALVRHPMYLGALIAGIGAVLTYRTWGVLFVALHWPVLLARGQREDEALAAEFGDEWERYRRRVPAWVPTLRQPTSRRGC